MGMGDLAAQKALAQAVKRQEARARDRQARRDARRSSRPTVQSGPATEALACPRCHRTWELGDACPDCDVFLVGEARMRSATPVPVRRRRPALRDLVAPVLFVGIATTLTVVLAMGALYWRG